MEEVGLREEAVDVEVMEEAVLAREWVEVGMVDALGMEESVEAVWEDGTPEGGRVGEAKKERSVELEEGTTTKGEMGVESDAWSQGRGTTLGAEVRRGFLATGVGGGGGGGTVVAASAEARAASSSHIRGFESPDGLDSFERENIPPPPPPFPLDDDDDFPIPKNDDGLLVGTVAEGCSSKVGGKRSEVRICRR